MANKAISELPQAENVNNQDLFVLEQGGLAKKLTAETFITEQGIIDALAEALDGHGGIQSVTLSSVSGRIRTYLITFTDGSATTFQVLDGTTITGIQKTSTAGLVDTYTVYMSDGTTSFFQVRNGQDGSATWDQINSKAPIITETVTGAIANFPDGADDIPVKSLVVNIEPVQDLSNGDPYPAGGSKNKAGDFEVGSFSESSAVGSSYANMKSSTTKRFRTANLIKTDASQFTVSADFANYRVCMVMFDENQQYLGKTNGFRGWSSSDFTYTGTGIYYVALAVKRTDEGTISATDLANCKLQLEFSASATSYTPYSNICPITGWTGANVTRTGKNLIDDSKTYQSTSSQLVLGQTADYSTPSIPLKAGTYAITVTASKTASIYLKIGSASGTGIGNTTQTRTFTLAEDAYCSLWLYTSAEITATDVSSVMLNIGSTATTYEPYQGTSVAVSWQTEAGTVYGGTLDVTTGVLTVDRGFVTYDGSNSDGFTRTTAYGSVTRFDKSVSGLLAGSGSFLVCNMLPVGAIGTANLECCNVHGSSAVIQMQISTSRLSADTVAGLMTYLSSNPISFCYKLATPVTYQLTPQQLNTLLGTNYIWADTGNTTIKYPADTKMYIDNAIAALA